MIALGSGWPAGIVLLERGWLSANNIVLLPPEPDAPGVVVDTGYVTHAAQTLALVRHALQGRPLARIVNTHLHSDHCGGNAALQNAFGSPVAIPPGEAEAVRHWDLDRLSYRFTGQQCAPFRFDELLHPGSRHTWGGRTWEVHAAPGHDPHAVVLFEPDSGTLISGDALWENGFGVVFPEIEGEQALDEVHASLDLIAALRPRRVIPGHGSAFSQVDAALEKAHRRLAQFRSDPLKHGWYAAKVLVKFHLLEVQREPLSSLRSWMEHTPYFGLIHSRYFGSTPWPQWQEALLSALLEGGAARREGDDIADGDA